MTAQLRRLVDRINRSESRGDDGFSLIELIIVIVILGILVAIAIPIYNNIEDKARHSAVDSAAANAASMAAANVAAGVAVDTGIGTLAKGDVDSVSVTGTTVDAICATATGDGYTSTAGPGCTSGGASPS